jgi:hypothetical protein
MIFPVLILGFVFSILVGSLAFLIRPNRTFRWLGFFLLFSCIGFYSGHFICELFTFRIWMVGSVNVIGGLLGSFIALVGLQFLGLREWK